MVRGGLGYSIGSSVIMGTIRIQQEHRSENAKNNAASSNSVPALRAEVVRISEAVQRLEGQVEQLLAIVAKSISSGG